ncbi:LuxR C-terminal-related transcriptional regulator [Saccharothrix longispora]|uniref:DNA-binding NarL/FixJ family response regulator n=1 Tax=Saccharothrix longispora TaxID=33920 RepID=A0ABU1PR07_9PSEU|nr:LuxR C-terminal-related transcriptional regulator [Saccharothrix longispora]MDR6593077.1 DNA-binding NarL/FixJ family response regulator [Saccharothrix longispora]
MLRGRDRQRVAVDAVLARARAGRGGVLVLHGEAGSGRTSLLRAARHAAADFTPDSRRTLLCVDDAHRLDLDWLLDALPELEDEPVAVLVTADRPLPGLPGVEVDPLDHATSVRVLRDLLPGLPGELADDVARTACGNPLALVELARSLTSAQLGGAEPPPDVLPPGSTSRARLRARFDALTPDARRALGLVLVDDELDVDTLVRLPGLPVAAVQEAAALMDPRPLVRSTLVAELPLAERYGAHAALAESLPDGPRRTWHRAVLAAGPRDGQADVLAEAAARARDRGDFAAAARDHQRAATLTTAPDLRARRLLSAAADHWRRGLPHRARTILREAVPLSDHAEPRALADLVRGGIEIGNGLPDVAARRLLRAAGELVGANRGLAVTALGFAGEAAAVAGDHVLHTEIAGLAVTWRTADEPAESRLTLDHLIGTAASYAGRHDEALPALRSVVELAEHLPDAKSKIWGGHAAYVLGDAAKAHALADRGVTAARESGLTTLVPWALTYRALAALMVDQHELALTAAFEGVHAATAAGQHNAVADHLMVLALLAALRGDADTALHRIDAAADQVRQRGLGRSGTIGAWASTCVDLTRDRPADALRRMRTASVRGVHAGIRALAAPDIVEAAVRSGHPDTADRALHRYEKWAHSTGTASRVALSHRCRALISDGPGADEHFTEAIRLHQVGGTPLELAKTELFYANRLRRNRKPRQARELLHDAVHHFEHYEADHWADRARAELRATGEPAEGPTGSRVADLTPQQRQIAHLVAEGATNREVAERLFLSRRTVEHHLRNIFTRLDIRSRVELVKFLD